MAADIWFWLNSFVDEKLNPECNEIVIQNSKSRKENLNATADMTYVNTNDLIILDDANNDLRQILMRMQKEMTELKESNLKILETVLSLKEDNIRLKKAFYNSNKLKNFNLRNNDTIVIDKSSETNDEVFEPEFIQQGSK